MGEDESLLAILARDNEAVLKKGYTHQQLAEPLFYMIGAYQKGIEEEPLLYRGQHFKVEGTRGRGWQPSPFMPREDYSSPLPDHTKTKIDLTVTNLDTGEKISFSGLMPDLIERYGFYEGFGTSYRLSPEEIIRVFGFSLSKSK